MYHRYVLQELVSFTLPTSPIPVCVDVDVVADGGIRRSDFHANEVHRGAVRLDGLM